MLPKKDRDGVKVALNIPRLSPKGNMVTLFLCTSSGESQGMSYTVLMFCIVQQFTLRDNPGFTQDEIPGSLGSILYILSDCF